MNTLAPESLASVPNARGFHDLRIPTYADICALLEQPNPTAYFYNAVLDEWVEIPITHINPPQPWGIAHADKWLSFPPDRNGRRINESHAFVWHSCGSIGASHLEDVRVPKAVQR